MKKLFLVVALFTGLAIPPVAFAHPGKTDKNGCHMDPKARNYHCHSGEKAKAPAKVKAKKSAPRVFEATVTQISDGDTIIVQREGSGEVTIKLYGIDAPENNQPGGEEAMAALMPIQGQVVKVTEVNIDRYKRMVALVEHEGRSVNLEMAEKGHAWFYPRNCKKRPICRQIKMAAAEARAEKRGIWAGAPVAPWEWRRK